MLGDIVYWTEYYIRKKNVESQPRGVLSDSLFIVSLCIVFNLLTATYIFEYYTGWRILQYLPIKSKMELSSWLYAVLLMLPVLVFTYCRYYNGRKLDSLFNNYERQPNKRRRLGKYIFLCYQIGTWGGLLLSYLLFKH